MRILMIPARANTGPNAYTVLMTEELERLGHTVDDITVTRALFDQPRVGRLRRLVAAVRCLLPGYDIIHIHWPHSFAQEHALPIALLRAGLFPTILWWQRLLGARVVWTVHDAEPMTRRHRHLTAVMMFFFVRSVDGFVYLNRTSHRALARTYPSAGRKPLVLTHHASYEAPRQPPAVLGNDDRPVAGLLGDIKAYKGLGMLLDAGERLGTCAPLIVVAGAALPPMRDEDIDRRLRTLREAGVPVVRTHHSRLSDAELSAMIAGCDLVVLPYLTGWNSGLAVLALEHSRPLLCSDLPVFQELRHELGDRWVTLFSPPLAARELSAAAGRAVEARRTDPVIPEAFLSRRRWSAIAKEITGLYERLRTEA